MTRLPVPLLAMIPAMLAGCASMPAIPGSNLIAPPAEVRSASDAEVCQAYRFRGVWKGKDQPDIAAEVERRQLDCPPASYAEALAEARDGDAGAMNEVGSYHFLGKGMSRDYGEACRWFQAAADRGHLGATANLATCYEQGVGGRYGKDEALRLYTIAAEGNSALAQSRLAELHARGQGVAKDPIAALKWYSIAADVGVGPGAQTIREKAAGNRKALTRTLSPDQVAAAQRLVTEWHAARPAQSMARIGAGRPQIETASSLTVTGPSVEIAGRIAGPSPVRLLSAGGMPVEVSGDGTFRLTRLVPIGDSEIVLTAVDEGGRTSTARVTVSRTPAAQAPGLATPNPFAVKGHPRPNALALIVAVESYENVPPADYAEHDAKVFYDYTANLLGVPEARIKLLTGRNARRIDVEKTIGTWLVPQIGTETDVFVYFSGHGLASDDGNDLFLLPHDGDRGFLAGSALRRREIISTIAAAGPRSLRLLLDTCYSGATRGGQSLVASTRPILLVGKETAVPKGVTVHSAAANDQLSSTLAEARHGLFTYFMMLGLQGGADADGDRRITDEELHAFMKERIPPQAARLGHVQIPQLTGDPGKVIASW